MVKVSSILGTESKKCTTTSYSSSYCVIVWVRVVLKSSFQNYPHPDDHTIRTSDTPGFKPFTILRLMLKFYMM